MAASAGAVVWLTGLSGAGKTTIARAVAAALKERGAPVDMLDGDVLRQQFPSTGFTPEQRDLHIRRAGAMARQLEQQGRTVVAALISPSAESRRFVRSLCGRFVEVYVSTPLEECERRDPKQLYARARRGEILHFTGISAPYEPPGSPEVVIDTRNCSVDDAVRRILAALDLA